MAVYDPKQLGINASTTGGVFQQGGWYNGRQYWNGTLGEVNQIHPESNQQGSGQEVSAEVQKQSANAQGVNLDQFINYLDEQRKKASTTVPTTSTTAYKANAASLPSNQPGSTTANGFGVTAPSINLPSLYKNLYSESGISDKETELLKKEKQFLEAKTSISDNPFSDASMINKKLQRLEADYNAETQPIRDEIAMKKADIETKLNLETKQFDIASTQAQLALSQFNTLLSNGALDGASGEDIANITRSTGLSSTMIQSAINSRKDKAVETSTISYDDGKNQGFAIINSKTGDIISKQIVAASKPVEGQTIEDKMNDANYQINQASVVISDYIGNKAAQKAASPEDFVRLLYLQYPLAKDKIMTAREIRKITGQ